MKLGGVKYSVIPSNLRSGLRNECIREHGSAGRYPQYPFRRPQLHGPDMILDPASLPDAAVGPGGPSPGKAHARDITTADLGPHDSRQPTTARAEQAGGKVFAALVKRRIGIADGAVVTAVGRYDGIGKVFGRSRPATGFSSDLNTLMELSPFNYDKVSAIAAPDVEIGRAHV